MTDIIATVFPATSGPMWGLIGVMLTQGINIFFNRKKGLTDTTAVAMKAVTDGNKQLTDGLFQQVKVLSEQVDHLRVRSEDCERRHDVASKNLGVAERRIELMELELDARTARRVAAAMAKEKPST